MRPYFNETVGSLLEPSIYNTTKLNEMGKTLYPLLADEDMSVGHLLNIWEQHMNPFDYLVSIKKGGHNIKNHFRLIVVSCNLDKINL